MCIQANCKIELRHLILKKLFFNIKIIGRNCFYVIPFVYSNIQFMRIILIISYYSFVSAKYNMLHISRIKF